MPRLVDANVLKKLIAKHVYLVADAFNSRDYGMFWTGGIEKAIDDAPTVDAELVRHGHWEAVEYGDGTVRTECSVCGYGRGLPPVRNYCPNCGAKMDEVDDVEEEPEINPCRGCEDYDGKGGCLSKGGCGEKEEDYCNLISNKNCSECLHVQNITGLRKYCHDCGVKMN